MASREWPREDLKAAVPMQITRHRPAASGVNQLMYVGDDAATAPAAGVSLTTLTIVVLGAWLLLGRR